MRRKWTIKLLQSLKRQENDMTLLTQGNAIKRKVKKTTKEVQKLEETTDNPQRTLFFILAG